MLLSLIRTQNPGSGEFQVEHHATSNVFKNDFVYSTSQGLLVNNYTNSVSNPVGVDYNLYYSSNGLSRVHLERLRPSAGYEHPHRSLISGNTIYKISGINNPGEGNSYDANGIYVDGGSQILIERNLIHHVDIGIEAAAEHKGKNSSYITIRNNAIYASNSWGITIGGYDSGRGGADHCVIVNNTLFGNDTKNTDSGEFHIQYFATNNAFKNNIVCGTSQGLSVNSYTNRSANPVDIDYNLISLRWLPPQPNSCGTAPRAPDFRLSRRRRERMLTHDILIRCS